MKFGGASVKDAAGVKNVAGILAGFSGSELLVVVSAMDKTTNQLEILAAHARDHEEAQTWAQFERVKSFHQAIIDDLFPASGRAPVNAQVEAYFAEVARIANGVLLLGEFSLRTYDRIVAFGELIATCIVTHYLNQAGLPTVLIDSRQLIRTDAMHTQANVIWTVTSENIQREVPPLFTAHRVVVAPGFIASTLEGRVTTLGREGSDYTAAIFAACLGAEKMTVWKDVPGIMSGDPRVEPLAVKHETLSYAEAVEMTFYGATVLHPKTIKPLYNAGIPLFVRSFKEPAAPGTRVDTAEPPVAQASRILKKNLALITLRPLDFSFMDEARLGLIFSEVARCGLQLNLVQTSAIELSLVVNVNADALHALESRLTDAFAVQVRPGMALRTILHFTAEDLHETIGAVLVQQVAGKLFIVKEA